MGTFIKVCDKAREKLRERKLFHDCLKFNICPCCGNDLEERNWAGGGGAYGDHLYCGNCDKRWEGINKRK